MTISLLTDLGTADESVGVLHSVINSIAPNVTRVDISHGVAPFDVRGGSLALLRSVGYLNPGVVLACVDPGAGTSRRLIAVEVGDGESVLVGPDNGLLAPAVAMVGGSSRAIHLTQPEYWLSESPSTFVARDVLAPVAAHLANGTDLHKLGVEVDPLTLLPGVLPLPQVSETVVLAEVLMVDRFGNAQLNVGLDEVAQWGDRVQVMYGGSGLDPDSARLRVARVVTAFDQLAPSELGLIVDSSGLLSLCAARLGAADTLHIGAGAAVTLRIVEDN